MQDDIIKDSGDIIDILGACPAPIFDFKEVTLGHGSGGKLTQQLIEKIFLPNFNNKLLAPLHDGAVFEINGTRLAFSTDSYVVRPIFFPGGDIGDLAVNGTVNDISMCGAKPLYLSTGLIIEEGFLMEDLWRVITSMKNAAARAGVMLVTGDTKVVDRGKGDQIYINTSGIGIVEAGTDINPKRATAGDDIIISGKIAAHGIAIMSVREGLEFEAQIKSDTAPLNEMVMQMLNVSKDIHVLRDATRGGVTSVLVEIAAAAGAGIEIHETKIPIDEQVKSACEMLGLDPLHVANEGKLIAIVPKNISQQILQVMKQNEFGKNSAIIGEVVNEHKGMVIMKTAIGGNRVVTMLSGDQLPRIC